MYTFMLWRLRVLGDTIEEVRNKSQCIQVELNVLASRCEGMLNGHRGINPTVSSITDQEDDEYQGVDVEPQETGVDYSMVDFDHV